MFVNNGKRCKLDYASAFDMGLVKQAFKNAAEISDDVKLKNEIAEKLPKLYPFRQGEYGICEWHKDYDTPEKGHRHFSPLYAFYPSNIIGYYADREKTEWIKQLFHYRTGHSNQYIGWSAAWAICIAARLREGEAVQKIIRSMLSHSVFKNLFCVHPPFYFQIDGNLGFVAGINEMLLTTECETVELLPALPENFAQSGAVKDMVVNGVKISFEWKNGAVVAIHADKPVKILAKHISDNALIDNTVELVPFLSE